MGWPAGRWWRRGGRRLGRGPVRCPHRHAAHPQVLLVRIVVDQRHREVAARRVAQHGGDDLLTTLARPDHDHARQAIAARPQPTLVEQAPHVADPRAGGQHDRAGDQRHRQRHRPGHVEREQQGDDPHRDRGGQDRRHQRRQLLEGAEAPPPGVEAAGRPADHEHDRGGQREPHRLGDAPLRDREVEAQRGAEEDRQRHRAPVGERLQPPSGAMTGRLQQQTQRRTPLARIAGGHEYLPKVQS